MEISQTGKHLCATAVDAIRGGDEWLRKRKDRADQYKAAGEQAKLDLGREWATEAGALIEIIDATSRDAIYWMLSEGMGSDALGFTTLSRNVIGALEVKRQLHELQATKGLISGE